MMFAGEILPPPRPALTDPDIQTWLDKRAALWKARLKLDAWSLSVKVCDGAELRPNTLGNIHWDAEKKSAVIRILNHRGDLAKMERTLVHELVHLELAALPKTDAGRAEEEDAVSRLADAFLALESPSVHKVP